MALRILQHDVRDHLGCHNALDRMFVTVSESWPVFVMTVVSGTGLCATLALDQWPAKWRRPQQVGLMFDVVGCSTLKLVECMSVGCDLVGLNTFVYVLDGWIVC